MTRGQLEHLIRAAAQIADDDDLVILGSQAILGQFADAPQVLRVSMGADLYPRNHPERADVVDSAIGELSAFHETFGYYAQGVGPETAVLPRGWEQRLVPVRGPGPRGATGWCLEAHDLVLSKLVAGREKDLRYARVALEYGLVRADTLLERLADMELDPRLREAVRERVTLARTTG